MCNGRLLMKDRQLIGIDEEAVNARTLEVSARFGAAAGTTGQNTSH